MAKIVRCDQCSKESTFPVFNWYKIERWAYPDHTDRRAPSGPWHFCSMTCIGEFFSNRVQRLDMRSMQDKGEKWLEVLIEKPPKPEPPPLRTLKEGDIPR